MTLPVECGTIKYMMRKFFFVSIWFPLTLLLLLLNLSVLAQTVRSNNQTAQALDFQTNNLIYPITASSGTSQVLGETVYSEDARVVLLRHFFEKYQSPMTPYTTQIVEQSDLYKLDYRLIPAIAMCESNLGKKIPGKNSFNPFGIAVFTGLQKGKNFDDWSHAITWVARYLSGKYYNHGITSLTDIGAIWAPPSVANGNSWASCVETFMNRII